MMNRHSHPFLVSMLLLFSLPACPKADNTVGRVADASDTGAPSDPGDTGGASGGGPEAGSVESGHENVPVQHPYVPTGAACLDYPDVGYRVFPYAPSVAGKESWPTCPLNCRVIMGTAGTIAAPLDQALPAGACDDEGATCTSPLMAGWCPPCTDTGGPGNGYACVCRGREWHCALVSQGMNQCDPASCIDPTLTKYIPSCTTTTWAANQVCACNTCRDLCRVDADCPSRRCLPNQVCGTTGPCAGPDECLPTCYGLCAPTDLDGGIRLNWDSQ